MQSGTESVDNTLVTPDVRQLVRSVTWPKGLVFDVVEYDEYINIRFYRENFNSFSGEDRLRIAQMVGEVITRIRSTGIWCGLEVERGDGRR